MSIKKKYALEVVICSLLVAVIVCNVPAQDRYRKKETIWLPDFLKSVLDSSAYYDVEFYVKGRQSSLTLPMYRDRLSFIHVKSKSDLETKGTLYIALGRRRWLHISETANRRTQHYALKGKKYRQVHPPYVVMVTWAEPPYPETRTIYRFYKTKKIAGGKHQ